MFYNNGFYCESLILTGLPVSYLLTHRGENRKVKNSEENFLELILLLTILGKQKIVSRFYDSDS